VSEQYRWSFHSATPNCQDWSPRIVVNVAILLVMFKVVKVERGGGNKKIQLEEIMALYFENAYRGLFKEIFPKLFWSYQSL